ncbi:MAG: class I SAM-dependent methyltransferase [Proteobacteria bacterium]|nr:class I SAM-dependent methyltransferase [Pseudomonadota bacterium]MBU1596686.1 class I SAM-dependent methyltransferase [Pseudomonadota bacterium]
MEALAQGRSKKLRIDEIVDGRLKEGNFRHEVAKFVPPGSKNILDYGFGDGSLLLWLRREKQCRGIYGVEVNPHAVQAVDGLYDKTWLMDLNRQDAHLEPEYEGFFSHILMPMSLEHTHDPWYVLKKMNRYLKPGGSVIIEVPNAQSWECVYRLLTGDFPYVSGGTWDFTHIRWYTLKSLVDMGHVCGFSLSDFNLLFPAQMNPTRHKSQSAIKVLELPPPEIISNSPKFTIQLPVDIKAIYPLFLALVLVVQLEKTREPEDHAPTTADGYLESYRMAFANPVAGIADLFDHPICPHLLKRIKERAGELLARHGKA